MQLPKVHVITLGRSFERRGKECLARLSGDMGWDVVRFDAVDGKQLPAPERLVQDGTLHWVCGEVLKGAKVSFDGSRWGITTVGELGAYLSHLSLWRRCVEEGKAIIIAEDDVHTMPHQANRLEVQEVLAQTPSDAEMVVLSYGILTPVLGVAGSPKVVKHVPDGKAFASFGGCMMYWLHPKGARKLLAQALPAFYIADQYMASRGLQLYARRNAAALDTVAYLGSLGGSTICPTTSELMNNYFGFRTRMVLAEYSLEMVLGIVLLVVIVVVLLLGRRRQSRLDI